MLKGDNRVGFELAKFDRRRPLVIDPVLSYSTYLGGSGTDAAYGIAVDPSGNAYVAGLTFSTNFPTSNAFQSSYGGGTYDGFVTKLSADGSTLLYSTYLGGSGEDIAYAIAVDSSGDAYVTGGTKSTNFPTTSNAFQGSLAGTVNVFVTKLAADGSSLVYSTYLGGNGKDSGNGIAVDPSGNAYVTGYTGSTNFPTTPSAFQGSLPGGQDPFVTKLSADGSSLVYSTYLGGGFLDKGQAIAVDSSGNAYVTGATTSTDFPTTPSAFQGSLGSSSLYSNAFVTKLAADGSSLVYSTYLGGGGPDLGYGIAVDPSGDAYVTGSAESVNFPTTPNAFQSRLHPLSRSVRHRIVA